MDREKGTIALGLALLLVAAAFFGALAVTGEHEDYYEVTVEIVAPEPESTVSGVIMVKAEFEGNSEASLGIFKVDGQTLETTKKAPFEWEMDTTLYLDGQHALDVVIFTENARFGLTQEEITINNGGTTVSIRSPSDGTVVSGMTEIKVDAVSPRGIDYVAVTMDGLEIKNASSGPFQWSVDTNRFTNGEHEVVVIASDNLGVKAQDACSFIINNHFIIVDERGKAIEFPQMPQRILSMGSSFTEIFYAINADGQVIGVDSSSKYPTQVSEKTNVGSFFTLNLEAVLATNPDCIVTWSFATSTVNSLESKGLKVVCYNPGSVDGVISVIYSLGNLTGHQSDAKDLVTAMKSRLSAVEQRVSSIPEAQWPKVYFELRSTKSVGPGTIANELISIAGGKNIYVTSSVKYPLYNSEYIISSNPDVIVIEDQSTKTTAQIEATAGWGTISAVQDHRILRINGELVSATPRLVDAVEQLADYFFQG